MSKRNNSFFIKRIRLINFHNFEDVTVDIVGGGHLFMLGDNGSGKTTVLDAVHYVLTAGEYMEFNAAARIAGSKQQGRRAQGIITRYNVDTGHMRPNGGVTYAALEIVGSNGKVTTAAVGMSVNSPTENLKRWGIIRDCELDELPFLIQDPEGERPRDFVEMKKTLENDEVFGQIHTYCNRLAERYLGGRSQFRDFCRFLAMGKAYREIASHTSDYHVLFKKLLPESDRDVFERIIEAIKSIEGSRGDLENLDDKLAYIRGLISMLEKAGQAVRGAAIYDTMALRIRQALTGTELDETQKEVEKFKKQLIKLNSELLKLKEKKTSLSGKLDELKSHDSGGNLARRQHLQASVTAKQQRVEVDIQTLESKRTELSDLERNTSERLDSFRKTAADLMKKISEKVSKIDLGFADVLGALEKAVRSDMPHCDAPIESLDKLVAAAHAAASTSAAEARFGEQRLEKFKASEEQYATEYKRLKAQKEAKPDIPDFELVEEELDDAMLSCFPLYKGLEWHPDLSKDDRGRIEELITEKVLSTIVSSEEEYETAAEIILNEFPGYRLALMKQDKTKIPPVFAGWAASVFDVNACNPFCLKILLKEMSAGAPPEIGFTDDGLRYVSFRSHIQSFFDHPPKLIGADARIKEQKRRLHDLDAELSDVRSEIKIEEAEHKKMVSSQRLLNRFAGELEKGVKELRAGAEALAGLTQNSSHRNETVAADSERLEQLQTELLDEQQQLKIVIEFIQSHDLEKLADACSEAQAKLNACEKDISSVDKKIGHCEAGIEEKTAYDKNLCERLEDVDGQYAASIKLLGTKHGVNEPEKDIEKLRAENRIHLPGDASSRAEKQRMKAGETRAELKLKINEIHGVTYGFSYDQDANELFARDGLAAAQIEHNLSKSVNEQHEIINEQTSELFKQIIMNQMIRALEEKVHGLEKMVRDINALLKNRHFGSNSYRIRIRPREEYERLLRIIKGFSEYNPELQEELEFFFQERRSEIVDTDPGEIPELLDYRNWYHYEMHVYADSGAESTMDARVKSIGSGGEQAVPNYLLMLTIAHFMFTGSGIKLNSLLFDEAFYGIDAQRRDQLMGFATDLGLQLFVASPDQDGVKDEITCSTTLLVVKDKDYDVHLYPFHWKRDKEIDMFTKDEEETTARFTEEIQ
jgi:energy-coupling factor transporter ATP-binding protein EcfA2